MDEERTLPERVAIFLSEDRAEREDVRVYLTSLGAQINGFSGRVGRYAVTLIAAAALFVLLSSKGLTEAEIFNIKVQNFVLFRVAIPVAMAYLATSVVLLMNQRSKLRDLYYEIVRQHFPSWDKSEIGSIPIGDMNLLFTHSPMLHSDTDERWARRFFNIDVAIVLLLPILFSAFAYANLFTDPKVPMWYSATSLIFAILLIAVATFNLWLFRWKPA
jgi:hypothetical protein